MTSNGVRRSAVSFEGAGVRLTGDRFDPVPDHAHGTVLFLHGGGQTRHSWGRTAERLAGHGWSAVTVDARGHGNSEWAPDGRYTLDAFVGDLCAVMDALDTAPALVGASLGGITALVAAGERHRSTSGVVLVDVAPRIDPAGRARIMEFMAGAPHGFGSLDEVADAIQAYNPHRPRPRNLEGLTKNVRQRADGRWYWHWDPRFLEFGDEPTRAAAEPRLAEAAHALQVPTMLVRGSNSDIVTDDSVAYLRELLPTARFEEVAAGHMVAGDDNDVFTTHLLDFLTTQVAAQR